MYGKPILVLSQLIDYGQYIYHEKFIGKKYSDKKLKKIIEDFLAVVKLSDTESYQVVHDIVDLQHSSTLSRLRYRASATYLQIGLNALQRQRGISKILKKLVICQFRILGCICKVYTKIHRTHFYGAVKFADQILRSRHILKSDHVVDVACGTGSIARILTSLDTGM